MTWFPSQMTWPDCSPPRRPPSRSERLEHVAVADRRRDDADPVLGHQPVEAEVRHHRDGDEVDAEREREDREDLVAVERLAALVDGEHAVAVAVEGDPEVEALARDESVARRARSVAPQPTLMFDAVGLDADREHLGAELLERRGRERRERAVRAVDADAQPAEIGAEALDDVRRGSARRRPSTRSIDPPPRRRGVEQRLDLLLLARRTSFAPARRRA